ncbi:type II toxin-antitoxin system PemK/MazF family toxin [Georgenia sp. AZ-5]|uniref:type II toxin-antitoxin system PemK/MazF family toxin n=1 Tax=Georgenia sp. AZ-5 TaxID=3367526 RepID=UPI00375452CF
MNPTLRRALRLAGRAASTVLTRAAAERRAGGRRGRDDGARLPAPDAGTRHRPAQDAGPRGATYPTASRGVRQVEAASRDTVEYDVARLGLPELSYAPQGDDQPDPGEVVWTWVPYEDDPDQGKDRPVLVLAREGAGLVVAQMTSKDHDRDATDEARWGRRWVDVGSGGWDARGRESEVRVDRLLWVDPEAVRRQGAALDARRFDEVAAALRELYR